MVISDFMMRYYIFLYSNIFQYKETTLKISDNLSAIWIILRISRLEVKRICMFFNARTKINLKFKIFVVVKINFWLYNIYIEIIVLKAYCDYFYFFLNSGFSVFFEWKKKNQICLYANFFYIIEKNKKSKSNLKISTCLGRVYLNVW